MKKSVFQRALCLLLSVTVLSGVFAVSASAQRRKDNTGAVSTLEEMQAFLNASSYSAYMEAYKNVVNHGLSTIRVDVVGGLKTGKDFTGEVVSDNDKCQTSRQDNPVKWENFGDHAADSVYLPSSGRATWEFDVPDNASGMYYLVFEYYNCDTSESSISTIERKLYIDGAIPFSEASYLKFPKTWRYAYTDAQTSDVPGEADSLSYSYETRADGYYKIVTEVKGGRKTVTSYKIGQDINGNSMAPKMEQYSRWSTYYCQDSTGYYNDYFRFHLLNGTHTITLEAQREPMIIKSISLVPVGSEADIPTYETVKESYRKNGYTAPLGGSITEIQAEFPDFTSDNSVSSGNDNSSSATYPTSVRAQLYNTIGKLSYKTVGQYAAYKFKVNESGLYKFGMRYKQSALQGMYICRAVKLAGGAYGLADGTPTVPFAEAYNAQFNFGDGWQSGYIGDGSGEAFEFYFEAGVEYTLYLECSLGSLRELIQRVENSLNSVNNCYLRILQLTGTEPDEYRDYNFIGIMPEVLVTLLEQAIELAKVADEFEELCGTKGSHIATLDTVALLLDRMGSDDGEKIAANMSNLKSYLGTLGTWINSSKSSAMTVDVLTVAPVSATEKDLPQVRRGFFSSLWHEVCAFFASFFTDYDAMGLTSLPDKDTTTVDVWLATGRDQSQIWRSMIDAQDSYTDSTGNAVTLKLVTGGTLLPSILAGKGPDVYMGLGAADVINYAIRDAVLGVSGNDTRLSDEENAIFRTTYYSYKEGNDYITTAAPIAGKTPSFVSSPFTDAVKDKYVPAAMDTLRLLGVTYGIPQGMSFAMMFYRTDVLARLGQEVPETWPELLALLPLLQANNMSIGLSYASALQFFLYQMGGNMWRYTDNEQYAGARIGLNTDIALESFDYLCRLYTDYSFPISFDSSNRFRTGEMPIIINDYTSMYNTLTVYATEIDGLWEFSSIPGWVREDGTFNYDSMAGVNATVLLHGSKNILAAWQFIQWQTGAQAQSDYGNQMVALIGPSAKYESANVQALDNLSWTAKEKAAIHDQMKHLSSVVNYPGSYIIDRYTKFAFLAAVTDGDDPVDAINGYIDAINAELKRKREEFGLKTLDYDVEDSKLPSD